MDGSLGELQTEVNLVVPEQGYIQDEQVTKALT